MAKQQQLDVPLNLKDHPFYGLNLDEDQEKFRDSIWDKEKLIVFCNAKSGSGKTTIALGVANMLVQYGLYKKIVYIASPTQEQKQGYLKGSLEEKSEPYFEPLYDAVIKLNIGMSTVASEDNMQFQKEGRAYIYRMTHTFLRGTNFEEAVIIIDEAQNFYNDEMKKVLTRIHDNCKVIVIGHTGQIDLYGNHNKSGFAGYLEYFKSKNDNRCAICSLTKNYRGWISSTADDYEWSDKNANI